MYRPILRADILTSMPAVPADLAINSRWILPMTSAQEVLENHALVVRDGRILDLLPQHQAALRYAAAVNLDRPEHLVMPGLVNAHTRMQHGTLASIAEMLKAGTTCFCGLGYYPEESAAAAAEQGMRALIGIPIAETASRWAKNPGEYLTRALNFRDEYRGHPTLATAFAPNSPCTVLDSTFRRIATLADELDAGIVIALHESQAQVDDCIARHGVRPIERLNGLGLLTPALAAVHMVQVNAADRALAQRGGIAVTLCPEASIRCGNGPPPVASWTATELRLGLGTGDAASLNLWAEIRLFTLLSSAPEATNRRFGAWEALVSATRGGAAALGLEAEIGTLEAGKWADLCCLDLRSPAMQWALPSASGAAAALVFNGGRDIVSDVWVAGRQLLNEGAFTRLDWPDHALRANRG